MTIDKIAMLVGLAAMFILVALHEWFALIFHVLGIFLGAATMTIVIESKNDV